MPSKNDRRKRTRPGKIDVVAFDADDTLWHNEPLFTRTQQRFQSLLGLPQESEAISRKLYEVELRNLRHFGYGIKGFTLSMIETAIELTAGRIAGRDVQKIIDFAREMIAAPVELLDGAQQTVARLSASHSLMIITKGDLFDQESKIARSGLGDHFRHIEIVSEKTEQAYVAILLKHKIRPERFIMVGNSVKSDILPVLAIGAAAVHVPYSTEWIHEKIDRQPEGDSFFRIENIGQLPDLLAARPDLPRSGAI